MGGDPRGEGYDGEGDEGTGESLRGWGPDGWRPGTIDRRRGLWVSALVGVVV